MNRSFFKSLLCFICILFKGFIYNPLWSQSSSSSLHKVLTLSGGKGDSKTLQTDLGLSGTWQKLLKLQTTASVMHTQAHPDDEQADLLTYLGRGKGVRTALLSLNRGESGGNILGNEFFDELALLRTEELLLAASYYGLDDLYFTNLVDYGFSKRVEEAYEKWGRKNVLEEMVRFIRINRPLVIISRFHGTVRDGHGNHQAAGEITPEAFLMAADPKAFPEQLAKEGLRVWKALKFYRGGVKKDEHWNIALNTGEYATSLGTSYKNFSLLGYSFHRSQFGGQRNRVNGPFYQYYERLHSHVKSVENEPGFFEGIDVTLPGIFRITGETPPSGMMTILQSIQSTVDSAIQLFNPSTPDLLVPYLTRGLSKTRDALSLITTQQEANFLLKIKERQFMEVLNSLLGISLQATALPAGTKEPGSFYAPLPTMGFAVPGQTFHVALNFLNGSNIAVTPLDVRLITDFKVTSTAHDLKKIALHNNTSVQQSFVVTIPPKARFSQPYYHRNSLTENKYTYDENGNVNLPNDPPAIIAAANYEVNGVVVQVQSPVEVNAANLPYGYNRYALKVAPVIIVNLTPAIGIIPVHGRLKAFDVQVELINHGGNASGTLRLELPEGWKAQTPTLPFEFKRAGEKANFSFKINTPPLTEKTYRVAAVAMVDGITYSQGYNLSSHRDLDQTLMYHPSVSNIKAIDVKIEDGLQIGYVTGVGDKVPEAIRQTGAAVELLGSDDLSKRNLDSFDAIVIGTRAYAVRQDLATFNSRLLQYAKDGGHLIVLFQTPEFIPTQMAPFPAQLPQNSEEVSEENSPVKILLQNHPVLNFPNKITTADFNHWVEQRGTKFFSEWDPVYVPIIATNDVGQPPQKGGWLMAPYGKGHYTYFAYSLHRQLPYGVKGAYRIMANLLSYGKKRG